MLRSALASLRYRKARLVLSSLAITAGVAFVTGTLVMGASINSAYQSSFAAGAKNVDAAVTPRTSGGNQPGSVNDPSVPASVLAQISSVPGVASAAGRLQGIGHAHSYFPEASARASVESGKRFLSCSA